MWKQQGEEEICPLDPADELEIWFLPDNKDQFEEGEASGTTLHQNNELLADSS